MSKAQQGTLVQLGWREALKQRRPARQRGLALARQRRLAKGKTPTPPMRAPRTLLWPLCGRSTGRHRSRVSQRVPYLFGAGYSSDAHLGRT